MALIFILAPMVGWANLGTGASGGGDPTTTQEEQAVTLNADRFATVMPTSSDMIWSSFFGDDSDESEPSGYSPKTPSATNPSKDESIK